MATFFHHGSSEIQAPTDHALQTLYLMNPNYVPSFSDSAQQNPTPPSMLLFNHTPPPTTHHLVGIPLHSAAVGSNNSDDHSPPSLQHQTDPSRLHYNLWGPLGGQTPVGASAVSPTSATTQQGLSLSLSTHQQPGYNSNYRPSSFPTERDVPAKGSSLSSVSAMSHGFSGVLLGSKYLKAAQELLDEVVHVGKGSNADELDGGIKDKMKVSRETTAGIGASSSGGVKQGAELNTAQRQELQMKKAKLVSMLDEVEQRYRQYHQQMQFVITSFEQAAGFGSAKSYTHLALETISKQFRCLKDAISTQIKASSKNLGEEECLGAKIEGSRLKYIDNHVRQQRALQQLGMVQHNPWRPQRGLPERAVSVLRAWLFEHFLHPYPKDSDKVMLAKQTGLTRSQVSNWFINARVRLWKPMVEEMYVEETKEQEKNGSRNTANYKESGSTTPRESASTRIDDQMFRSTHENFSNQHPSPNEKSNNSSLSASPMAGSLQSQSGFNLVGMSNMQGSPKKRKSSEIENSPSSILSMDTDMKVNETNREITTDHANGFGTYPIPEIERFDMNPEHLAQRFHGNGVSLTLGLPHRENISLSGTQQSFLSNHGQINIHDQLGRRFNTGGEADFCAINHPQPSHSGIDYEDMDMRSRKRFAAQLLPDFVA
ncbi:PREDICTED: BEL1 homeodomain [Prunus dulcis]|uniref:PREDICTED: BEL1 homeodomain n=1 Tax=Prunus dulcis TaxID=3755 RepID=A0A5E4FJI5_PRUDU|nr:BEL1-like homeodomain protein 1 [Prunus dulcis]XP_034220532.1 BEL1-like homeodomain protein 1 [Prunus dulcis]VVA27896.1 PREDICTED: BEL1 homeodomain [Prunus dulcis]